MEQDDVGDGQCVARLADMLVRSYRRLNRKVNLARKRVAGSLCVMLRPSPCHLGRDAPWGRKACCAAHKSCKRATFSLENRSLRPGCSSDPVLPAVTA